MMPESPVWLRSKKRFEEADLSEKWLRLPSHTPTTNEKGKMEMKKIDGIDENAPKKSVYLTRPIVMPLIIGLSLLVLQQISGIDAIIFFTVEIFRESGNGFPPLEKRKTKRTKKYAGKEMNNPY